MLLVRARVGSGVDGWRCIWCAEGCAGSSTGRAGWMVLGAAVPGVTVVGSARFALQSAVHLDVRSGPVSVASNKLVGPSPISSRLRFGIEGVARRGVHGELFLTFAGILPGSRLWFGA